MHFDPTNLDILKNGIHIFHYATHTVAAQYMISNTNGQGFTTTKANFRQNP